MKKIGIKIISIFLILIFFMNCGFISLIPVFALSEAEKEAYLEQLENDMKTQGYQIAKIIQSQEIKDWKQGDNFKSRIYDAKWGVKINDSQYKLSDFTYMPISEYEDLQNKSETELIGWYLKNMNKKFITILNAEGKEEYSIKEGANIFSFIFLYDLSSGGGAAAAVSIVDIEKKVTNLHIVGNTSVNLGETLQLETEITPSDATVQDIKWSTSDSSIVSVDSTGKIRGKQVGKATITARVGDVSANHEIEVKPIEVTSIVIEGENIVQIGNQIELNAIAKPVNATDKTIEWVSGDESIATVDEGIVTGIKEGKTIIIAKVGNITQEHEIEVIGNDDEKDEIIIIGENCVQVEKAINLIATINGEKINEGIIWSSSNEELATVDENGTVFGKVASDEEVIITAEIENSAKGEFYITVKENIPVENIKINAEKNQLKEKEELQLEVMYTPSNVTDKNVAWFSIDEEIASVNEDGKVIAKKAGEAIIIAITKNMKIATFKLKILGEDEKEEIYAESITINGEKNELKENETLQLEAIITPENVTDKEVIWISGNEELVTIDENGIITGKKQGNTTIIAMTNNMKIARYEIKVVTNEKEIYAESIKINGEKNEIKENEELQLETIITPENVTNKEVKWISSNEKIASVDEDGKVIGKSEGSTNIIAMTSNMKIASYEIKVFKEESKEILAESITINGEKNKIDVNEKIKLDAIINPENVTDKQIEWKSSNTEIAKVDENGNVTGLKKGEVIITATSKNNVKGEYTIEVIEKVSEKNNIAYMYWASDDFEIKEGEKCFIDIGIIADKLVSNISTIYMKLEYPTDYIDITILEENGMKILSTEEIEEKTGESFEEGTIGIILNEKIEEKKGKKIMQLEVKGIKETENAKIKIKNIVLECENKDKIALKDSEENIIVKKIEEQKKPDITEEDNKKENNNEQKENTDNKNQTEDENLYKGNLAYAGKNIMTYTGLIFMAISSFILYKKYKII